MQTFADTLLVKTGCQVSSMISGAKPKLNGKIAGIIDFGDVEEDINLRSASERSDRSTNSTLFGSAIMDSVHFHIEFAPLYDLLSVSGRSEFVGTPLYTGSIATTDEFAREVRTQGSQPVEMHTILLLLADLVAQPVLVTNETLYIGLPTSLYTEERDQVSSDPQFRSLSLRALERRKNDKQSLSGTNEAGTQSASLQVLPTMSKQEKVDIICGGIVGYIADMFMLPASEVDENGPLTQYIDSLTGVQLRGWLLATFHAGLTTDDISKSQSIRFLAEEATTRLSSPK